MKNHEIEIVIRDTNNNVLKIEKVPAPVYDAGSYARNPANHVDVEFSDGEVVSVRIGDGETIACGLRYQPGEKYAEYGRLAIEAAEKQAAG